MRIENYRRHRPDWLAWLVALAWLVLIAMVLHTALSFAPRCREFDRQMESMRQEMDSIKQGWEDLRP